MYFPIGWPKYIKQPFSDSRQPCHIVSSCDRMLFAILFEDKISIWYCKPTLQIVNYSPSASDINLYGTYLQAEWKSDSSAIAVMTSKCFLTLLKVDLDISVPNHQCWYVNNDGKSQGSKKEVNGTDSDNVPAIKISVQAHIQLTANITCCVCVREELAIATEDGCLSRFRWNGTHNSKGSFAMTDLTVATDFLQSRGTKLCTKDGYIMAMEYSPIIGGYCLVLSTKRALLLMSPSPRNEGNTSVGVWAADMSEAVCLSVNHRYRLIAYGCTGAYGVVYSVNEVEGTLEAAHKLQVSCKNFPNLSNTVGPVTGLKWTPDGSALAMAWKQGGFALWSVFGSLLFCTVGGDYSSIKDHPQLFPPSILAMEWGLEGYQMWLISSQSTVEECDQYETVSQSHIMQLQFVKSSLTVNPCVTNHEHVFLQGEDKLYINTGDVTCKSSQVAGGDAHILVGSKQWQIIPISHSYLASNWPIRYSCVDKSGQCVAVAGKTGLAHYALFNRKWKLFGNESQERDMVVSGGMSWWKDFICVACYNIVGQRDEIRCYPRGSKLDNTFANIQRVLSQVLLLNIFNDILLVFCIDSHVMMFSLDRKNTQPNTSIDVIKVQEVALNMYIPHPVCVTGVLLTSLKIDQAPVVASQLVGQLTKDAESMLLNVAGKLLVFQRDRSGPQIKDKDVSLAQKPKPIPFAAPSIVATNVENLWTSSRSVPGKLQLTEALWLGCGSHGMKVWLPLFPRNENEAHNFMSKRIMLPFRVDIYPLAVLFEEAVILGVASDALTYMFSSPCLHAGVNLQSLPFCTLERTSQIYLNHILKQLLKRNLGVHALKLAYCCTELSYFSHVLELLLHEVLEAEATSKDPIPDPLLPRVVAFIQEFPEYLQTFVHCARKTEVALWPHLFTTVGNPKDLFEECLISGRLETAASYLIILQNLEKPMASRQHATLLLDSAIEARQWELAQDLVRFLKAIDPNDADAMPPLAYHQATATAGSFAGSSIVTTPDRDTLNFSNVSNLSRMRSSSISADTVPLRDFPKDKPKLMHTKSDIPLSTKKTSPRSVTEGTTDHVYIDTILCRHARKLLSQNRVRDLGYFAANIKDFQLLSWLKQERMRCGKVEDFVTALHDIHHQFDWPLPVLSLSAFQQLKRKAFSTSSLSSLTLLDEPLQPATFSNHTLLKPQQSGHTLPKVESFVSNGISDDIILRPQICKADDSSLATMEISDSSSLMGDFDFLDNSASSTDSLSPELELLSQEIISKGPQQSELELRYLFQIMLEAGCLEWSLIFAIVLRDSLAVIRTINTASMTDTPLELVARMREGLSYLELWSETECVGYKPFLHVIHGQIHVLKKLAEEARPALQLDTDINPSLASVEEGKLSPGDMSIRPEVDLPLETPAYVLEKNKQSDCVVS